MIPLENLPIGTHRLPCPECAKGEKDTALSVTVEDFGQGVFHCFRCGWKGHLGDQETGFSNTESIRQAQERRRKQAAVHQEAATRAEALFQNLTTAPPSHAYLARKMIEPGPARVTDDGRLVLPVYNAETDELQSLQFINVHGGKKFFPSGRMAGGSLTLGDLSGDGPIALVEGFATGASVHVATGWPVVVAFTAGNLPTVARAFRQRYPNRKIILAGDNDDAGISKATEAATVIGAHTVFPPEGDFNDHAVAHGIEAVREVVMNNAVLAPLAPAVWGDIEPLPHLEPEVPNLPPEMLPASLRPYLVDAAERAQIPLAYVGVAAMVGLGAIVGRTVGIYPKELDDWLCVPNLWGVLIGRPGVMKSPAVTDGLYPLHRLAAEASAEFVEDAAKRETEIQIAKAEIASARDEIKKAVKSGDQHKKEATRIDLLEANQALGKIEETSEKRYIVNDGTVEKIGELLNRNSRGLLLERDELFGFLRTLDKSGREGDREFYLEAWNGTGRFTYDRIGRGTIHIDALCLSIVGTIQPGKFRSYVQAALKGGVGDDGLIQRFQLAIWPDIRGNWKNVDRVPDAAAQEAAYRVFYALDNLEAPSVSFVSSKNGIPGLRFAPDAQEMFNAWRLELETRLRSPEMEKTPAFESHLAKYRSLMPSIALLLQLADDPDATAVSLDAAKRASAWCEFLEQHARKIYAAEIQSDLAAAHQLFMKIKTGHIEDGATVRDIYRPQWSGLSTPEEAWTALQVLERHNILRVTTEETGGRSTDTIHINPAVGRSGR